MINPSNTLEKIFADVGDANQQSGQLRRDLQPLSQQLEALLKVQIHCPPIREYESCNSLVSLFYQDGSTAPPGPEGSLTQPIYQCTLKLSWVNSYAAMIWRKIEGKHLEPILNYQTDLPSDLNRLCQTLFDYL